MYLWAHSYLLYMIIVAVILRNQIQYAISHLIFNIYLLSNVFLQFSHTLFHTLLDIGNALRSRRKA